MKLFYALAAFILLHVHVSAQATWTVTVSNNQFSPSTVNAVVGDVVHFVWSQGFHTTTCGSGLPGTSLPAGAAAWDSPMTSGNTTFDYTVNVEGTYNYGCIPHFEFGMTGTIIVSGPLPVKLGAFNVSSVKNIGLLQWQTYSESNTDYFSIRKSTDGKNFNEIGKVKAAGNSDLPISYTFADNDLGSVYKFVYYELVTVDNDKTESFSPIKTLRNTNITKDNLIVALSPNPITRPGQVQLKFNADKAGDLEVSIFSSTGQRVQQMRLGAFYGLNNGHLHVCDLSKGTYTVVFTMGDKKEVRKIVVL